MKKILVALLFIIIAFSASAQQYIYPGTTSNRSPVYGSGYPGYIPGSLTEVYLEYNYGAFFPTGGYSGAPKALDFNSGMAGGVDLSIYINNTLGFNFSVMAAGIDSDPDGSEMMDIWHFMLGLGVSAKIDVYPFFELFVSGGVAAVGAKFDIPFTGITYNESTLESAFGFYLDVGGRAHLTPIVYVHLRGRYLNASDINVTTSAGSSSLDMSGFYVTTGVGVIF